MKIGNISFNPEGLKGFSKDEVYKLLKGKIDIDFNDAWNKLCEINGKDNGSIDKPSKKSKGA